MYRKKWQPSKTDKREKEVVYIHASKTRIIEIYEALKSGKKLDGRGQEI